MPEIRYLTCCLYLFIQSRVLATQCLNKDSAIPLTLYPNFKEIIAYLLNIPQVPWVQHFLVCLLIESSSGSLDIAHSCLLTC